MSERKGRYDVKGLRLSVDCETSALFETVSEVLGRFPPCPPSSENHSLIIRYTHRLLSDAPAPGLRCVGTGQLPDGIRFSCCINDTIWRMDLLNLGRVEIDFARKESAITIVEGEESVFLRGCFVPVLCKLLPDAHHHVVHAGTLRVELDDGPRAALIAGTRDTGKTTSSLALAREGMKLMGDDVCFVTASPSDGCDGLRVWGLLLDCKVHRRTLDLLPWLGEFPSRPARTNQERLVDVREELGVEAPLELPPAAIFFLTERNDTEHRVKPLGKLEAVELLARENIRPAGPVDHARAGEAFRILTDLAGCCETYLLSVGPDLATLPKKVLSVLGG